MSTTSPSAETNGSYCQRAVLVPLRCERNPQFPGSLRGPAFLGGHPLVGLSEPREKRTFAGYHSRRASLPRASLARCGLYVIDLATGNVAQWLWLDGFVTELNGEVAPPGVCRPSMIGFRSNEIW